jgi:DnaJ-class molecular chaperone
MSKPPGGVHAATDRPTTKQENSPVQCPHCSGEGGGMAHINRGPDSSTHSIEWVDCISCKGSGEITQEHAARIVAGRKMRDARVAQRKSLMEAAAERDMSPAELSAIEMGRK